MVVGEAFAGTVEPEFLRAGAVAPGLGSSNVRPLVPQAVNEVASALMAKRASAPLRHRWDRFLIIGVTLRAQVCDAMPALHGGGSVRK